MLKKTKGIVLRNRPHHDADLIVTYLTPCSGVLSLYAKSPRKVGSRFGSSLEPLTYARIGYFGKEHTALPRLTQSDIVRPFNMLRESTTAFLRISEAFELTLKLLPEREPNRKAFPLLLNLLASLEQEPENPLHLTFYKLKLLSIAGYAPRVGVCPRCGKPAGRFYFSEGSTLCSGCAGFSGGFMELSPPVQRVYNYLLRTGPETVKRLRLSAEVLAGLEALISSHINYTVVDRLNTREFAEGLKSL
ncbi:MAG TPA: DNA repair protein RecO [Nitrospirae bacterium]|nr:DNA repair protein RecO [Nitrospirota bacterium]